MSPSRNAIAIAATFKAYHPIALHGAKRCGGRTVAPADEVRREQADAYLNTRNRAVLVGSRLQTNTLVTECDTFWCIVRSFRGPGSAQEGDLKKLVDVKYIEHSYKGFNVEECVLSWIDSPSGHPTLKQFRLSCLVIHDCTHSARVCINGKEWGLIRSLGMNDSQSTAYGRQSSAQACFDALRQYLVLGSVRVFRSS